MTGTLKAEIIYQSDNLRIYRRWRHKEERRNTRRKEERTKSERGVSIM